MPFEVLAAIFEAIGDALGDGGGTDAAVPATTATVLPDYGPTGAEPMHFSGSDNWGTGANESYRYATDMTINGHPVVSDASGNLAVNNGGAMEPVTKNDTRITTK